jgi:hypothetical protein
LGHGIGSTVWFGGVHTHTQPEYGIKKEREREKKKVRIGRSKKDSTTRFI